MTKKQKRKRIILNIKLSLDREHFERKKWNGKKNLLKTVN